MTREIQKGGAEKENAELFLENARKSFLLASKAASSKNIERYAAMGRDYLKLAHEGAEVEAAPPLPQIWNLP